MKAGSGRPPGLILADIQLADGSSGMDAVIDLLASFEVPVIFITAYPERFSHRRAQCRATREARRWLTDGAAAAVGRLLVAMQYLDVALKLDERSECPVGAPIHAPQGTFRRYRRYAPTSKQVVKEVHHAARR